MGSSVIVSAARTPIGSFMGALSGLTAPQLGAIAIKAALQRAGLQGDQIQEVIMGCVLTAGIGQAPARQAAIFAGLPHQVPCTTVGKVCGSGLKTVMLADQAIRSGDVDIVLAGGMESMSNTPYSLPKARAGYRMGPGQIDDLLVKDGLWDPYNNLHMGNLTELCAKEYKLDKAAQDAYAVESYKRALAAIKSGAFKDEIASVEIPQKKGSALVIENDEEPGKGNIEKLPNLNPAFQKDGTVSAGNASSINDGAAAVIVMSEEKAKALGLKPLARIVSQASAALAPEWFTMAPSEAMAAALSKANLKASDIDLWEVNEAFSAVALANNQKIGIPVDKVNVNGGAVALGHPIGASGTRILVSLLYEMKKRNTKRGLASLCIGGGEGVALIVEAV